MEQDTQDWATIRMGLAVVLAFTQAIQDADIDAEMTAIAHDAEVGIAHLIRRYPGLETTELAALISASQSR